MRAMTKPTKYMFYAVSTKGDNAMQISVIYGALFYCLLGLYLIRKENSKRWQRPPYVLAAWFFGIVRKMISQADVT